MSHTLLLSIYQTATHLTLRAVEQFEAQNREAAVATLAERRQLLREIHRSISAAPAWGAVPELDGAALTFIKADQRLDPHL